MRDASIILFRACRSAPRGTIAAALLVVACGLGGCAGSGSIGSSFAMASTASGPTVAFESIDGPPPQVFERMVGVLDSESKLRSLSIVSREGSASYRVRSYLAAQVSRGRTTIAWVWDVYDQNQQRALRLSGEEPAGKAGRDAWAAADDLVLAENRASRIERAERPWSTARSRSRHTPAPAKRGPAVASADQPAPASGEWRVSALGYTSH